jgi:transcriptional regulator with XRE-family HTH domain
MDIRRTMNFAETSRQSRLLVAEACAEANIDRSYVGRIERGMENVTVSAFESLTGVVRGSVAEFFVEVDGDASRPPPMKSGRKRKV